MNLHIIISQVTMVGYQLPQPLQSRSKCTRIGV